MAALSPRQLEVAKLVASGSSSREIADKLSLSPRTVEKHISDIFEKLGVRTRVQLAAIVVADPGGRAYLGNVAAAVDELVGRENDIATIARLTHRHRLVTLLGTGGIGKTQTAIRVATRSSADYPDGLWFIDLLSLNSGELIASEIARLLDFPIASTGDVIEHLVARLKPKRALLIFDNCEHLVGPAGVAIAAILRDCGKVNVLATSREPIGVSGEARYRLPPLAIEDASALFIARARAVDHRFPIDGDASAAVAELCRKLDCIPLAIELASARSNIFSPRQLLERLGNRFTLLEGSLVDVAPRHHSMRAVIDWSYDQLDDRERRLFRRLAVFTGQFSLQAAHAISGLSTDVETPFIEALSSLIDKSLVVAEAENEELSYRLLESTRLYARLKLREHGEDDEAALLHVRYLAKALETITARAARWTSRDAVAFFRRELGDIRTALAWALRSGEYLDGAKLLAATHFLWSINSIRDGIEFTDAYLAALDRSHAGVRANLLSRVSELYWRAGNEDESIDAADRAVVAARESGDEATLGEALIASAVHSILRDGRKSRELLSEAEALENTNEITRDECLHLRARLTYISDDYELAIPMYRTLNEAAKRVNDTAAQAECTMVLAIIEHRAGRYDRAVDLSREGIAVIRDGGEAWALALCTSTLAGFLIRTGALDEAKEIALESLTLYADIDRHSPRIGTVLDIIGYVLAVEGDVRRAARIQGLGLALGAKPGVVTSQFVSDMSDRFERFLRDGLSDEELTTLRASGAALTLEDVLALATAEQSEAAG